jgi:hypothetical protein
MYLMLEEMLMRIENFMLYIKDGSTVAKLKNDYPHGNTFSDTYDVVDWWRMENQSSLQTKS